MEATREYGATVLLQGGFDQTQRYARRVMRQNGMTFIHAFDDPAIVAGQGAIGLEILEQAEDIDTVVVPVGGAGLISGIGLAIKETMPGIRVIGVQAEAATATLRRFYLWFRSISTQHPHPCSPRSLSEKQCSKRYASLVECKDANYSTTTRLL